MQGADSRSAWMCGNGGGEGGAGGHCHCRRDLGPSGHAAGGPGHPSPPDACPAPSRAIRLTVALDRCNSMCTGPGVRVSRRERGGKTTRCGSPCGVLGRTRVDLLERPPSEALPGDVGLPAESGPLPPDDGLSSSSSSALRAPKDVAARAARAWWPASGSGWPIDGRKSGPGQPAEDPVTRGHPSDPEVR